MNNPARTGERDPCTLGLIGELARMNVRVVPASKMDGIRGRTDMIGHYLGVEPIGGCEIVSKEDGQGIDAPREHLSHGVAHGTELV